MGYPTCVFTIYGRNRIPYKKIAPIFLFQINYNAGSCAVASIPSINLEVIRQYCSLDENEQLNEMIKLENELGLNNPEADFDIIDLVTRLKNIRLWNWKEEMNPEALNPISMQSINDDGIYNKAILLHADASKYTQGLEYELLELSKLSEEQYRNTALYNWIHRSNEESDNSDLNSELLEVLPLNIEQNAAIKAALSSSHTVITGPPGTGKSQVVTDLIINLAWKGKKTIFSSKNNKAVDVVEKRVNGLTNRPIMLRLGSHKGVNEIITYLEDLRTNSSASREEKNEYHEIENKYHSFQKQIDNLSKAKNDFISLRNELDIAEQNICAFRNEWVDISSVNEYDATLLDNAIKQSQLLYDNALYSKQNIIIKLLWKLLSQSRIMAYNTSIENLNKILDKYHKPYISNSLEQPKESVFLSAVKTKDEMNCIVHYNDILSSFISLSSLEEIDKALMNIKTEQSNIANQLWSLWVKVIGYNVPFALQQSVGELIATLRLNEQEDLSDDCRNSLRRIQSKLIDLMPICAVTSLSVRNRIPLCAGIYDTLIIDEASQCDIPSILPLLYRCKSSVIIGDPKQLSHITGITRQQDKNLLNKYNVNAQWSYKVVSLYDFSASICNPSNIIQLKDHHRCHGDIIEFSNHEFYQGSLRVATNYGKLQSNEQLGIRWINVKGQTIRPHSGSANNKYEVDEIIAQLKHLVSNKYQGSIGVVTPFKSQAELINRSLERESDLLNHLLSVNMFIADTVHKFQGDERDLIIFSTVISLDAPAGAIAFLNSTGNLFNVAITRAKSTLIVIGDRDICAKSGVSYLEHFVEYVRTRETHSDKECNKLKDWGVEYPLLDGNFQISEWEKILYSALYKAGIKTHPQYHIDKYYLDLALLSNGKYLDIEVDGERYHRNWNGELCYRDQLRNQRLFELGWDVKRFWVYEIRDRLPWCVEQIKAWIDKT